MFPLAPADVVKNTGEVGKQDKPSDTSVGDIAPFLDEDQCPAVYSHLFDVDQPVAGACAPLGNDSEPSRAHRLAGKQLPGKRHFPLPL